jgi:DNA transposition AAA+ family ATPase
MRSVMVAPIQYDEAKLRETQPYKSTVAFLRKVIRQSVMAVLEGEPGVGKTFGALSFAQRHGIPFITVIERVALEKAPSRFFRTMVAELVGTQPPSLWDALEASELWARNGGSPRALFLDEAQWLTGKALDVFRRLHDMTGATIVFIGHEGELSKLFARYPQARDRVAMRFVVPPLTLQDIQSLHPELPDQLAREVFDLTQGNFRRLQRLMSHLSAYAKVRNKPVSELTSQEVRLAMEHLLLTW